MVYGEGWWIDDNGAVISRYPTLPWDPRVLERDCFICQPAAFIRASAYRRCGLDPDINRSFDYDLWIRMAKLGIRFAAIPEYLANSRMHTGAKTIYEREAVFEASIEPAAATLWLRPALLGLRLHHAGAATAATSSSNPCAPPPATISPPCPWACASIPPNARASWRNGWRPRCAR